MNPSPPTTPNAHSGKSRAGVFASLAGPVLYLAGLWGASLYDGVPLGQTVCFDPVVAGHATAVRLVFSVAMALGASLLLFATPWLLGSLAVERFPNRRATAGAWSLIGNSAALLVVCLVLRHTTGLHRGSFLVAWMAWTAMLFVAAGGATRSSGEIRSLWRRWGAGVLIALAAVTVGVVLFHREQFVQCFNGDGIETFELARSLRHHFLPYWEIETIGRFGTVIGAPSLINSYWTSACQILLGENELGTRLPFWVWWLGIFVAMLAMVRPEKTDATWLPAVPLALFLLLATTWYTFYVGHYPYMADVANPGIIDAFYTLLLLLAFDCLRHQDLSCWGVLMVMASLVVYAGPVVFVITAFAAVLWQPVPRRRMCYATVIVAGMLVSAVLFYVLWGWLDGSLPGWFSTLDREIFRKYSTPGAHGSPWHLGLWFVGYYLLGCGVIPALGLLRGFEQQTARGEAAWDRTLSTVALVYLLIILGSGYKNLHYLVPILTVPLLLWLRLPADTARRTAMRWAAPLLAAVPLGISIFVCWPVSRPTFVLNRQLGAVTTFQTDSYEEACRWARISLDLYNREILGWQIGEHTWARYAHRESAPSEPRPLLVTDQAASPQGYQLVFESDEGVKLFRRESQPADRLLGQQPPAGRDRCPPVFRPISISPRPRQP